MRVHEHKIRVYIEDTDAGGIVYYANYLKFAERGRTEMSRELGIPFHTLMNNGDLSFVVRSANINYLKPAKLGDELTVKTSITDISGPKIFLHQEIWCADNHLTDLDILLICVTLEGKVMKAPGFLVEKFNTYR